MFTYWANVCHWVLPLSMPLPVDQELFNSWKRKRKKRTCCSKTCFENLRTEHTQQGPGNTVQISSIQEEESTSMQLCTGACEPGKVCISFPCLTASSLLPVSWFHSFCGGFSPSNIKMPQCTRAIAARSPHDKALPRSLPAACLNCRVREKPREDDKHKKWPFQPLLLSSCSWWGLLAGKSTWPASYLPACPPAEAYSQGSTKREAGSKSSSFP